MPRLPGVEGLGGLPSGRSGRVIATFDETPIGEGIARFGAGLSQAGQMVQARLERDRSRIDTYNAEAGLQEFSFNEQKAYTEAIRSSGPDNPFDADQYAAGYRERAKGYMARVPELLRPEVDQKLFGFEQTIFNEGQKFQLDEQLRVSANGLQDTLNSTVLPRLLLPEASTPDGYGAILRDGDRLIDANPGLTPIQRDAAKRVFREQAEIAHAKGLPADQRQQWLLPELAASEAPKEVTELLVGRLVGHTREHIDNMSPVLQDRLATLFQMPGAPEGLGIYSGARTNARQTELWNEKTAALRKQHPDWSEARITAAARQRVAPPGRSRHERGDAADLSYNGQSLARAPKEVVDWVHANAAAIGLGFPVPGENWHVEPVESRGGSAPAGRPYSGAVNVPAQYRPMFEAAAAKYGLSPDLLARVAAQESNFNAGAVSPRGATGLMQLMPGTAGDLGVDANDPAQNIDGGARYLRQLFDRYGGDEKLALMAYNWGMGNVDAWRTTGSNPAMVPKETQKYVAAVMGGATQYAGSPYTNMSIENRQALAADAEADMLRDQTALAAQLKAQNDALTNQLMLGIIDGTAGMGDISLLREQGVLTEHVAVQKAINAVEARDKELIADQRALGRVASGDSFNPFLEADKDDADRAYRLLGGHEGLNEGDPEAVARVRSMVDQTGIMPGAAIASLRQGIWSRDPKVMNAAFAVASGLLREAPDVTGRAFGEADLKRIQDYEHWSPLMTPEQLSERLNPDQPPRDAAAREILEKEGRDLAVEIDTNVILDHFDPGAFSAEPLEPVDPNSQVFLRQEFEDLFAERYAATRDPERAQQDALEILGQRWGITDVGGEVFAGRDPLVPFDLETGLPNMLSEVRPVRRLMRYPPEKVYPTIDGTHEWLAEGIHQTVLEEYPGLQSYGLVESPETEAAIRAGQSAPYWLWIEDENGVRRGRFITFDFDAAMAEDRERRAQERLDQPGYGDMIDQAFPADPMSAMPPAEDIPLPSPGNEGPIDIPGIPSPGVGSPLP